MGITLPGQTRQNHRKVAVRLARLLVPPLKVTCQARQERWKKARLVKIRQLVGILGVAGLLYGCSGSGYLPYAAHALQPGEIRYLVSDASHNNGVPEGLVRAVLMAESAGNPSAVSAAGAQGLMQLMPGTSSSCGIANPFDPMQNVECGTTYLRSLLIRYHNDVRLAVAAYNAGPGAVDRYHGVPPYPETQAYVTRVLAAYRSY
jgi:soluble lytic murein transglycosylase-like protein